MPSLVLLILLSCLTLHACDARRLRLSDKAGDGKQIYHFSKYAEKSKAFETSITSSLRPPALEECISQQQEVKTSGRNNNHVHSTRGGVHKQINDPNALYKKQDPTNGATSGNENTKAPTSFQKDLQLARNIKGLKRNVRSLEGSVQHDSIETADVQENDQAVEDIVVMDYAQPHRKPPIHNEKP
ncbi:hypothetical protein F2P56_020682 [Juglans regia]|uniref:Uncharacterized protein LOC109013137 n=2 Tax=Juglans regia TaxID=51240 RepID=A0A2I4H3G2_JUGRE|nr:uncharacterized protein LOC109013137 [Juglans regia]KAF5460841.1 hypothetical protein F2P56_020682 [Juglans regia]